MNALRRAPLLSGLTVALISLCIITLTMALLLHLSSFKEDSLSVYIYFIHGLALLIGGLVCGQKATSRGWYYGGITGIAYCLIILLIAFLGFNTQISWATLFFFLLSIFAGAFGGILGVNMRK